MTANRLGIDFSQDYFDLVLAGPQGQLISPVKRFEHTFPGSQQARDYVLSVCQQHPADHLWVGGESTGLLWWHLFQTWATDPLLEQLSPVFYLLNPSPVKQFRKAASPKDKTDREDPRLIARYLGLPDLELCPWQPDGDDWPLRFLTRFRYRLAHHLTRLKLQALSILHIQASAYPFVEPFHDLFGATSRQVLRHFPTLDSLAATPLDELAAQLNRWSRGKFAAPRQNALQLLDVARLSYPISPQLAQQTHFILDRLLDLIELQQKQMHQTDQFLAEHFGDDCDLQHLDGIGGIGPVYAAGLVAELRPTDRFLQGQKYDRQRGEYRPRTYADAQAAVAKLAGLWWPRNQSGEQDSQERHMPRAGNPYLRYYLVEAANHVREHVEEYAHFYQQKVQEARKHHHQRALVLTARKLARLVFALLHNHQAYQPRRCSFR